MRRQLGDVANRLLAGGRVQEIPEHAAVDLTVLGLGRTARPGREEDVRGIDLEHPVEGGHQRTRDGADARARVPVGHGAQAAREPEIAPDELGVFGQVDYRRMFLDENTDGASGRNDVRVLVGVRMILD